MRLFTLLKSTITTTTTSSSTLQNEHRLLIHPLQTHYVLGPSSIDFDQLTVFIQEPALSYFLQFKFITFLLLLIIATFARFLDLFNFDFYHLHTHALTSSVHVNRPFLVSYLSFLIKDTLHSLPTSTATDTYHPTSFILFGALFALSLTLLVLVLFRSLSSTSNSKSKGKSFAKMNDMHYLYTRCSICFDNQLDFCLQVGICFFF